MKNNFTFFNFKKVGGVMQFNDYACCRSTLINNLEKKFGRPIRLLSVTNADNNRQQDGLKRYIFSIGKETDEDAYLRITTTENGLILKLLELLPNGNGGVCTYCENKDTDNCIQTRLKSGNIRKEDFVHKMDKKLCFA